MNRLFVALKIPDPIKFSLIDICKENSGGYKNLKWEPKEKIHLTLKFIGEIKSELVQSVCETLDFIRKYEKVNCSIEKFGFLYRFSEPQILWVELKTGDSLFSLVEELNEKLFNLGIEMEKRKFKPHFTLLRLRKNPGQEFIKRFKGHSFNEINFKSSEISLFESKLQPSGSVYKEIKKYELR